MQGGKQKNRWSHEFVASSIVRSKARIDPDRNGEPTGEIISMARIVRTSPSL